MPGTFFGLMDAVGYIIIASVLFLPVVWFVAYFLVEIVRAQRQGSYQVRLQILEETSEEMPEALKQKTTSKEAA